MSVLEGVSISEIRLGHGSSNWGGHRVRNNYLKSLVRTTEELLESESSGSVLENRD
jgi:hypothetical protein